MEAKTAMILVRYVDGYGIPFAEMRVRQTDSVFLFVGFGKRGLQEIDGLRGADAVQLIHDAARSMYVMHAAETAYIRAGLYRMIDAAYKFPDGRFAVKYE